MSGSTAVHRALERVGEERDAVEARKRAFETFEQRVREVPAANPTPTPGRATATPIAMTTAGGTDRSTASTAGDRCVTVRDAFADIIEPHSTADLTADEPLVETIAAELTEDVAVALATETGWTPALKTAVLEEVATRQREADLVRDTLRTERRTLETARDEIDGIVAWLQTTADESLLQYGFDALQAKHERLESHRERLEELTAERQVQFTDSTNRYGPGGTRYRTLIASVYSDCPVRYPLLSTATRLYRICGGCQRTVRAHLIRRV